jgi:hypothetical protein
MAAFKVLSPLVQYLQDKGLIKAFAGQEGELSKIVTLNFPGGAQNGDPFYFASDSSLDGSKATITAIELVDVVTLNDTNTAQGYKDNITVTAAVTIDQTTINAGGIDITPMVNAISEIKLAIATLQSRPVKLYVDSREITARQLQANNSI